MLLPFHNKFSMVLPEVFSINNITEMNAATGEARLWWKNLSIFVGLLIQGVPGYQLKSVKVQLASLSSLAEIHLKIKVLSWRLPWVYKGFSMPGWISLRTSMG